MVHWEASYKFGKANEETILPLIRAFFKRDIQQYPNQYDDFDFYDDVCEYELKSRTNTYNKYPTTMITLNKTQKPTSKRVILLFNFTDGLYYIEYNSRQFSTYQTRRFSRLGASWDEKEHIFIPICDLKKVDLDNPLIEEEEVKEEQVGGFGAIIESENEIIITPPPTDLKASPFKFLRDKK